jgi:mannose-6-phosphate isomerase-like protein (cupin superfamily)
VTDIDTTEASPDNYKILSENDEVRVVEMIVKAGESDNEHSYPNEAAYFITGGKVRIHLPDGNSDELEIPDGFVLLHDAWTHRVQNIGETDVHAIVFEPKS